MTGGFWYPYNGFQDANSRIGGFADRTLGRGCGITYSDGQSLSILRNPTLAQTSSDIWLHVLRQHASVPKAPPPTPHRGRVARLLHFFQRIFEIQGQVAVENSRASLAVSRDIDKFVHDRVWVPSHEWMLGHKKLMDGGGVVFDCIGVMAGVALIISAPALGTAALVVGASAAIGSFALLAVDGTVWGFELHASLTGEASDEALAHEIEDIRLYQWVRIVGTLMLLPDIAVGGLRALKELGTLPGEAREFGALAREAEQAAAKQLERSTQAGKLKTVKRVAAAKRAAELTKKAKLLHDEVHEAQFKLKLAIVGFKAAVLATPGTTALVIGMPPGMVLSDERKERDESVMKQLSPEGGMPGDVKLELRVSGSQSADEGAD